MLTNLAHRVLRKCRREYRNFRWNTMGFYRDTVTIHTKQGVFSVCTTDNGIGWQLYCNAEYEWGLIEAATAFVCKYRGMSRIKTVLDIGANMGITSISMLKNGLAERAVAVEPEPNNFSLLQKNVQQNGLGDQVVCVNAALSDSDGVVEFELNSSNLGDHRVRKGSGSIAGSELYAESARPTINVQSKTVDDVLVDLPRRFADDISLVWIDVQGFEGYVFMGGARLFSRDIPVVAEIWPYGLRRAGTSAERFCEVAQRYWSHYRVVRPSGLVLYPISTLNGLFDELGYNDATVSAVFTRE